MQRDPQPSRLLWAFVLGCFLYASIVAPARAIVPLAVPIINGFRIVAPLVAGGAARSVPIVRGVAPLTPSAAGVVGTLGVLIAAQTAANFKPRSGDHPQVPDQVTTPATVETQAPEGGGEPGFFIPNQGLTCRTDRYQACIDFDPIVGWTTACFDGVSACRNASGFSGDRTTQACEMWRQALGGLTNCTTPAVCPSGFTLNQAGTMCERYTCPPSFTLNAPLCVGEQYAPDDVPTIRPSFPGWELDPLDPDPLPSGQSLPSGNVSTTGPNADGDPTRVTIEPLPDGGMRVTTEVQHNTGGNTQTTTTIVNISPGGQVGTPIMSNTPGAMPANPPTSVTPGSTPVGGTGSPGELPTDYARENTLQGVKQGTDALKADSDAAKAQGEAYKAPNLPEGYGDASKLGLPSGDTFEAPDAVPELTGSGACSVIEVPYLRLTINPCPWLDQWRPIVDAGWLGLCAIATMMTLLRRPET